MRRPFGILIAAAIVSATLSPRAFAQEAPTAGEQAHPAAQTQQPAEQGQPTAGQQDTQSSAQPAATTGQQDQQGPQKVTFTGDVVLWAFTVHPNKTAEYEQVLEKLKTSLVKLGRMDQAAGWKIIKNTAPQGDGTILYIHVIDPVVAGADYSITNIVYEAFPDPEERIAFYELYRGAISAAFFTIQAPVVADLSK
jgi:hypothetical protein